MYCRRSLDPPSNDPCVKASAHCNSSIYIFAQRGTHTHTTGPGHRNLVLRQGRRGAHLEARTRDASAIGRRAHEGAHAEDSQAQPAGPPRPRHHAMHRHRQTIHVRASHEQRRDNQGPRENPRRQPDGQRSVCGSGRLGSSWPARCSPPASVLRGRRRARRRRSGVLRVGGAWGVARGTGAAGEGPAGPGGHPGPTDQDHRPWGTARGPCRTLRAPAREAQGPSSGQAEGKPTTRI